MNFISSNTIIKKGVSLMETGMSRLSCAIILEKHGITTTIFEKGNSV